MAQILKVSTNLQNTFLSLVRLGVGKTSSSLYLASIDWNAIEPLAKQQGLLAIVIDGVEAKTNLTNSLPLTQKLTWIGEVMQGYEQVYAQYTKAIAGLAAFYNAHGFRMMVLKGYASALNWPKPEHRPCSDIDIYLFGKYKEADEALTRELGIKIDHSHQHHTVFQWQVFSVENHYDFINVHHHKSNVEFESILKELADDDSRFVMMNGQKVYMPSPNFNALFLLKHLMMHFAAEGITLRQVLDWGFFVKKHKGEVDWEWLEETLERFGMMQMCGIINAICVDELGFESNLFAKVQYSPILKDRVLKEILTPDFSRELPKSLICRAPFKYRRWKANEWKHELCYNDSMKSAFWSGVWNHIQKPSSI